MIFLLVAGAIIVGAPLAGALLVTIASLHEDSERSLSGRPPGHLAAAARKLLGLRAGPGHVTGQYLSRPRSALVPLPPRRAPEARPTDRTLTKSL